ncbi:hypothetical protein LZ30DRAFT_781465 [Colletotrichum cereale]|nr:hypothetical protein LZ30DRAFT_781465 [Colletotrichum cereale]
MQYSIFTLLAVAAAFVAAAPAEMIVERQTADSVPVDGSAMTNAAGEIIPFDTAGVYQAAKNNGL